MAKRAAFRARVPSRRPKKRRPSAQLDPQQVQSWPSWTVKRARTGTERRDWASLGDGPAGVIAELLLARDVADYLRFRAVCRPWRRCCEDPRSLQGGLDGRYHPRHWVMLDSSLGGPRRRRFLNVCTGECVRTDLPELEAHTLLALTAEGLLFLLDEGTHVVRLLNPLTRQLTDLPPVTALLTPELQTIVRRRWRLGLGESIRVYGVGVVAGGTAVAISFFSPMALVVAKPGDERWTSVVADVVDKRGLFMFTSVLISAGRMYCATGRGVMVLDAGADDEERRPPRLLAAVDWGTSLGFREMTDSLHLVDNGGDLMLVHRMLRCRRGLDDDDDRYESKYKVYKVDLDAGVVIPARSFGGRAVFMGTCRSLSVGPLAFPLVDADTLYLGSACYDDAAWYNVVDGRTSLPPAWQDDTYDESGDRRTLVPAEAERMGPASIVNYLSYCIRSMGQELASSTKICIQDAGCNSPNPS